MKNWFKMPSYRELLFQVVLHVVVFIFYAYDRHNPEIKTHLYFFFLNYAVAAAIINYILLPKFLYQNKNLLFSVYFLILIGLVIFIEEGVLEPIFFPDSIRAKSFPGVFPNLLSAMPSIAILSGFKFAWDALQKQKQMQLLKDTVKESEMQFLKSQINPHFLFNNMNNLYAHAMEKSPKTPEIILELSAVLRYMLYECSEDYVLLNKEVEQLKNYMSLHHLQIEGRGDVSFKISNVPSSYKIAPLILMVFIENAFKHSASSQSNGIQIDVDLSVSEEGILRFYCSNSFMNQSNTDSLSHGIGLENVKKRLELLYPDNYELAISTDENRYAVHLTMNLLKDLG